MNPLMRNVRDLLAALMVFCAPVNCAHEPVEDEPLFEELLFAELETDKPKPRESFPLLDLPIEDEIPDEEPEELECFPETVHVPARRATSNWQEFQEKQDTRSVGKSNKGKLVHGREMPDHGPGFIRKNDKAYFGTDETVAMLLWACQRMTELYPGTVPVVIGDISSERGGRLRPHASHQSGRDVDIGYYFVDNSPIKRFKDAEADNLDVEKTWTLLELFLFTHKVDYLFIDKTLQEPLFQEALSRGWSEAELATLFEAPLGDRKRKGIIRHQKGHRHHFHIRFVCPEEDRDCD